MDGPGCPSPRNECLTISAAITAVTRRASPSRLNTATRWQMGPSGEPWKKYSRQSSRTVSRSYWIVALQTE